MATARKRLIVNADDYGYYPFVTTGILEGIDAGMITATGVFANSETFSRDVRSLKDRSEVDVGVHLNLTFGQPITASMRRCLRRHGGRFTGKWQTIAMLTGSAHARKSAHEEIEAQVLRCIDEGLDIQFLNSHEHVHLLPGIWEAVQSVAKRLGIRYIRRTGSEKSAGVSGISSRLKGNILDVLANMQQGGVIDQPRFLGLGCSGSITLDYLGIVCPQLLAGRAYELMCHPGEKALGGLEVPQHLQAYHDWHGEKALLVGSQFRELLARCDIELIRFRDLKEEAVN